MRFVFAFLAALLVAVSSLAAAQAQPDWADDGPVVEAELISDMATVAPGEDFHLGIHQVMREGWHTYWRNPGDNGLPITLDWTLPDGVELGEIAWPAPVELALSDQIMDYGYYDEVVLPLPVALSDSFAGDRLDIAVTANWLVCEEICIPEEQVLELSLPVAANAERHEENYWHIQAALEKVPPLRTDIDATLNLSSGRIVLALSGGLFADPAARWRDLKFFPHQPGVIQHAAEQHVEVSNDEVLLITEPGYLLTDGVTEGRAGVLTYEVESGGSWQRQAVEIRAEAGDRNFDLTGPETAPAGGLAPNFVLLFLAALGGGLVLNLMPCVFPILSIKALKVVQLAHSDAPAVRVQAVIFLAGVLASFILLAAILLGLREVGVAVGWGFQLQVPVVVAVLALLLFAIGLNLMGVFEVGSRLMGLGAGLTDKPGWRGAFFTGVLAVVVAAPCVGPLAAGALGLAMTQPAPVVLLIAAALGLGLGAPFVLFSFFPALLARLPGPGPWMITFRQFLAFPMFASVVWLAWVLAIQSGSQGVLLLGTTMVAFAFAIWAFNQRGTLWKLVAALALAGAIMPMIWIARLPAAADVQVADADIRPWSRTLVADLRADGQAVFVDVTAAWCVTCQVNKMRVLHDARVEAAFADLGVARLQADWTNRDDEIAALIYEHGQAGVPLYLLYPANGGPARVLPTVLSKDGLIAALETAAGNEI